MNTFRRSTFAITLALSAAIPGTASAALTSIENAAALFSTHNLVSFGDTVANKEIESRSIVGGSLTTSNAIQFGFNNSPVIPKTEYAMAVYGGVIGTGPFNINQGSFLSRLPYPSGLKFNMNSGGSAESGQAIWDGFAGSIGFGTLEEGFKGLSAYWDSLPNTGTTSFTDPNQYRIFGDGSLVSVVDITATQLANAKGLETKLNGSSLLIINVSGSLDATFKANFMGDSKNNADNVIWNFTSTNSTTLIFERQVEGSVLAPYATVHAEKGFEGLMVAQTIENSDEGHFRPINSNILPVPTLVPEPGIFSTFAMIGFISTFGRRRRK